MKISRSRIIISAIIIGLVVLVQFAMRDIKLDIDLLRESLTNMSGIIMENIQMSREVSGDIWRIKIPLLHQDGNTANMQSVDIRKEANAKHGEWYFFGHGGVYSHDEKAASINGLLGTLEDSGRTWNLESKKLNWYEENSTFIFPEGLVIYDDELSLNTTRASMDNSGVILLEQGGVIQWQKSLKH